jgi:hypothetical protein
MRPSAFVALATLMGAPLLAVAEVMDKEPSLSEVWLLAIAASAVAFVACRWKPWLALATAPLPLLYLASFIDEVTDRHVGPAIISEAGVSYVVLCSLAFLLVAGAHAAGIALWRRSHLTAGFSATPSARRSAPTHSAPKPGR